jgi:hypothetical protein
VALEQALLVAEPAVTAHGPVPERMLGNAADGREKLRASIGYTLIGLDDEANSYTGLLERTQRLYEDAGLRKGLAKQFGLDPGKLPKLQTKRGPSRLPDSRIYQLDLPSALYIPALGKDSKDADPKRLSPLPIVLVTCREGQRTWIAISSYSQLAEDRLAGVLSAAASEATLAHRSGLEPLQRDRSLIAGFWTLSGLGSGVSFGKGGPKKFFASLGPSDVPILLRTRSQTRGPSGEAEVDIPARVFRDAAAHLLPKPERPEPSETSFGERRLGRRGPR